MISSITLFWGAPAGQRRRLPRRPLWEDGKLLAGREIPWMADRQFSGA